MAFAAEAARMQGGDLAFLAMHNLLFRHRRDRPEPDYAALARRAGLDADRLLQDMSSPEVREVVEADMSLAVHLAVEQTPTGTPL